MTRGKGEYALAAGTESLSKKGGRGTTTRHPANGVGQGHHGRRHIPAVGANGMRGGGIFPQWEPMAYSHGGSQWHEGRRHIPAVGANGAPRRGGRGRTRRRPPP
eukprot:3665507-Pyramimonas_sp.AAC.1